MELHIALNGRRHLTRPIYQQLCETMVEGRLEAGDRLPPTRELAQAQADRRGI